MKRALLALALCLAASSASLVARGDGHKRPSVATTWAAPAYRTLPEGSVLPVPDTPPPLHIPAAEKAADFRVAPLKALEPKARHMPRGHGGHKEKNPPDKTATRTAVAVLSAGGVPTGNDEGAGACFADAKSAAAPPPEDKDEDKDNPLPEPNFPAALPKEWPGQGSSLLTIQVAVDNPADLVRAIHAERFVRQASAKASLDVTDAWVDLRTSGVRLIEHYELPLIRVLVGPNGLEVYAARDRRALQVVVVRAAIGSGAQSAQIAALAKQVRAALPTLQVRLPDGSEALTDCGHLRFALRTAPGAGQMATLESVALLPPLQPVPFSDQRTDDPEEKASLAVRAMRRRPFQLSMSATQSLSDPEPVVSLSMGWTGREQPGDFEADDDSRD